MTTVLALWTSCYTPGYHRWYCRYRLSRMFRYFELRGARWDGLRAMLGLVVPEDPERMSSAQLSSRGPDNPARRIWFPILLPRLLILQIHLQHHRIICRRIKRRSHLPLPYCKTRSQSKMFSRCRLQWLPRSGLTRRHLRHPNFFNLRIGIQ